MKEHVIEILFAGFQLSSFFENLEDKGILIDLDELTLDIHANYDIAYDIIGFPRDNYEIDTDEIMDDESEPAESKDDEFYRDWLRDDYFERIKDLKREQDIYFVKDQLQSRLRYNEEDVRKKLAEHVDWAYLEYEKYKSENND